MTYAVSTRRILYIEKLNWTASPLLPTLVNSRIGDLQVSLQKKQQEVSKYDSGQNDVSTQTLGVESSVAQIALLHRISGIVSSNQELRVDAE